MHGEGKEAVEYWLKGEMTLYRMYGFQMKLWNQLKITFQSFFPKIS
jgi:hypothetical protein